MAKERERPHLNAPTSMIARGEDIYAAAIALAANGWPVLPLNGKRPATRHAPHGVHSATTNLNEIETWDIDGNVYNIGIAIPTGVIVLDLDPRNSPHPTASAMLDALEAETGPLPETVTVASGGGGLHLWFLLPAGMDKITARPDLKTRGVDVLDHGRYVVGPPSIHPTTGTRYRFTRSGALAALPERALAALTAPVAPGVAPTLTRASNKRSRPRYVGLVQWYADNAVKGNRNRLLSSTAWRFLHEGQPADAFAALSEVAQAKGLTVREIEATFASARRGYERQRGAA